jgi:Regulator of Chromosome Condensation (RCC1) repeat protein
MKPNKASLTLTIGLAVLLAILVPAPAAYAQSSIVQVSAGWFHTCALFSDGSVQCWGSNSYGQSTPQAGPFTQITAGYLHTCGLKSDGSVICWGNNEVGQAAAQTGPFTQIDAGLANTCGVKTNGDVGCWGDISHCYNELGICPSDTIKGLQAGPFTQVSVSGSDYAACALTPYGAGTSSRPAGVHCWGSDSPGGRFGNFTQITVGGHHNCVLTLANSTAECWGGNLYGQSSPPSGAFLQLSAGNLFTCGLLTDHTLACWGYNFYGQVKDTPSGTFKGVAAGYGHACAWDDYHVSCWGRNDHGQATPIFCLPGSACGGHPPGFAFQGFYPPLAPEQADPPALNVAEAGSAAPLKFSLGGNYRLDVIAAGYPASQALDCNQFGPSGVLEPVQSAGGHGLSYDAQSGTYTYVWKTDRAWAGTCRVLALKLVDGTEHLAAFRFQ